MSSCWRGQKLDEPGTVTVAEKISRRPQVNPHRGCYFDIK